MTRAIYSGLLIIATLGSLGCASLSPEECRTADWQTIGFEDGAKGMTASGIARHRKACAKAGVTADQSRYEAGRRAGLKDYCQPQRGYDVGRQGQNYQGVCPAELEGAFLEAYEDGRYLHGLEQGVRNTENALSRVERDLEQAGEDLRSGEAALIDASGSRDERAQIVAENRDISEHIGQLELERDSLLIELGERREQLRNYVR